MPRLKALCSFKAYKCNMFDRIKNIWALSGGVKLTQNEMTGATIIEPKEQPPRKIPQGMATIVDIENNVERDFPAEPQI